MDTYSRMTFGLLTACACFGQSLSVGAIGGVRGTDDLTGAGATSVSKRYVVGPALEIGLPLGFGVEVDALYRREGYQTGWGNFAYSVVSGERANSWEFPMLLKYHLPFPKIKPFLEAGIAPRTIRGTITSDFIQFFPVTTPLQHSTANTNWPPAPIAYVALHSLGQNRHLGIVRGRPIVAINPEPNGCATRDHLEDPVDRRSKGCRYNCLLGRSSRLPTQELLCASKKLSSPPPARASVRCRCRPFWIATGRRSPY